jgi:polysaccharide pyruvyl transferase WcaK-like protein
MSVPELLAKTDLDDSLILSYGGGGNYGDELLLEVLLNMLKKAGVKRVDIAYLRPERYTTYHHDFGYRIVDLWNRVQMLHSVFRNKNIIVGGGGLWGLDMNLSIFIMSLMLWCSRWLLGKKVYLLGVGYYNSTNKLGHAGAYLAAKAANVIVARDTETRRNFERFRKNVTQDHDMVWYSRQLDLSAYQPEAKKLDQRLPITAKTLFITLRRFDTKYQNDFKKIVEGCIAANPDRPIIVALLEPREVNPEDHAQMRRWAHARLNVRVIDFSFNPLALLLYFQRNHRRLVFIGPQFHGLLTAHLAEVPLFPLVYDNKSQALLEQIGHTPTVSIYNLKRQQLQAFIDEATRA